jgi:hypothetical protein
MGRWRGVVSLKPGPDGQRRRKKVSGKNKTEVRAKLAELHDELNDGVVTNAAYTVAHAIEDWQPLRRSDPRRYRRSRPSMTARPAYCTFRCLSWPYPSIPLMVMLSDWVAVSPRLSVTFIMKLKVPAFVGVPERMMSAPGCACFS